VIKKRQIHKSGHWKMSYLSTLDGFVSFLLSFNFFYSTTGAWRGRDRLAVGFTTTCAISAYHHWSCKFESWSWRCVLDTQKSYYTKIIWQADTLLLCTKYNCWTMYDCCSTELNRKLDFFSEQNDLLKSVNHNRNISQSHDMRWNIYTVTI
jgi:hypothetical protein